MHAAGPADPAEPAEPADLADLADLAGPADHADLMSVTRSKCKMESIDKCINFNHAYLVLRRALFAV